MHKFLLALLLLVPTTDDTVWRALDSGDAAALKDYDTAKLLDVIKKGRPVENGKTGETSEDITDAFGRTTDLIVKVPSKYDRAKPAGVILVLHGLGGNSKQLKDLYQKFAEENNLIIAAPSAQKEPEGNENEDNPPAMGKGMPHWWSYREGNFAFTALALLKKRYAIDENRVILSGYSMGGFGSWNIGLRYPDRFAAVIPFAGGISRAEYLKKNDDKMRPIVQNAYNTPFYFVHGDRDTTVGVNFDRKTRDRLKELGYDHVYVEVPKAGHIINVREGSEIMNAIQEWLKPKKRNAHPKAVSHHFIGSYCPQAYWVRVAEFSDEAAEVKARVDGQKIDFTSTGAKKITFYVDETLLDLSKPVKVTSGGKTLFDGKVEPSVDVILETWKAREDRDLCFRAKLTVEVK